VALATAAWGQAAFVDDFTGTKLDPRWTLVDTEDDVGSATVNNGVLSITAGGSDIWNNADGMSYLYFKAKGDFMASVKVLTSGQVNEWSKQGIMVRASTDPDSAHAFIAVSRDHGTVLQWRLTAGDRSWPDGEGGAQSLPCTFRITRIGTRITAAKSLDDGKTWTTNISSNPNSVDIPDLSSDEVLVGIAVTSHQAGTLGTATFSHFVYTPLTVTIKGTVKDNTGKPVANTTVSIEGPNGVASAVTDANGAYSAKVVPGDYQVMVKGETIECAPGVVTGAKDGDVLTVDLTATNLPNFSISTGAGVQWLVQGGGSADDNSNADPKLNDTAWDQTESGTDIGGIIDPNTNTYFWYRAHFKIPDAIKAYKDRYLVIYDYCIDDYDWTYLNGHFLGNTNNWNTQRRYIIDPAWVNWDGDNVIAIKGWQGGGGVGFNTMSAQGPQIHVGSSLLAVLKGNLKVAGSSAAPGGVTVNATPAAGGVPYTATPDNTGGYALLDIPAGDYNLTVTGRTVVSTSPATAGVTAAGGKVTVAPDITITYSTFAIEKPDATISDDFNASTLNAKWTATDLGTTDAGDQSISNGVLVIHADGADFWTGGDNGRFIYQKGITGDFQATLHVLNVPDTDGWSKVGIMARDSTDPMSLQAFACATRDNGESLQGRTSANPEANFNVNGGTFTQGTGYYVKLLRKGAHFEGYKSPDGVVNMFIGEFDNPSLGNTVLLGIGVTSHSAGNVGEAKVDDFVFSSQLPGPVTPPPPAVVKGDASGDGKVLVNDAVLALQFAVGLKTPTAAQLAACDLNGDGKVGINEATLILQAAVGLRTL
jgi:hypothetical protein